MKFSMMILAAGLFGVAGCGLSPSYIESRTTPERAEFGASTIDVPPAPVRTRVVNAQPGNTDPIVEEEVTGTWTFTTPPTVTRVEKRNGTMDQFTLYNGRPEPTDRPFVVITVSRDRASIVEKDPATYRVSNTREYVINGGIAQEWTGMTDAGAGFCELIVRRPGTAGQTGDVCHAMALARNEEEQKLALPILGSIVWKAAR